MTSRGRTSQKIDMSNSVKWCLLEHRSFFCT
jgi:hypothetical protein